jgi:type IV pilus assembly protein PilW
MKAIAMSAPTRILPQRSRRPRGIGLIEVLVALVLGALAVVIVLQVLRVSEGARRTTVGGDDALNSGTIALAALQRDLRQAGHGLDLAGTAGCALTLPSGRVLGALAPATVNPAGIPPGDPGTDTLQVVYGDGVGSPEGSIVHTQPGTNVYAVAAPTEFARNDLVLAVPATRATPCALALEAVGAVSATPPLVTVAAGRPGMAQGILYNLGREPTMLIYAIRAGRLTACDPALADCGSALNVGNPAVWAPVAEGIVSLRVQYGRDTSAPADGVVDTWDQLTPTTPCGWARVRAARLVVVARSGAFERDVVTALAPVWAGGAGAPIDLSADAAWQNFRYRSFETTVPLRNLTWREAVPGC